MSKSAEYYRAYYAAHKEACRKYSNDYRKRHLAERAAYMREWRKRNSEHYAAYTRKYLEEHKEEHRRACRNWQSSAKGRAYRRRYDAEHPEHVRRREANRKFRMMTDAAYYARYRANVRVYLALTRPRKGEYRPVISRRIPDWCVKGQRILDARSAFLAENLTPSQRAWLKERTIESKNWRER